MGAWYTLESWFDAFQHPVTVVISTYIFAISIMRGIWRFSCSVKCRNPRGLIQPRPGRKRKFIINATLQFLTEAHGAYYQDYYTISGTKHHELIINTIIQFLASSTKHDKLLHAAALLLEPNRLTRYNASPQFGCK